MNKAAIYIALLFACNGLLELLNTYNRHQNIVLHKNGLQFADVDDKNVVAFPQRNDIFITHDHSKNETYTYKSASPYSGSGSMNFLLHKSAYGEKTDDELTYQAINGDLVFTDTLRMNYHDRIALISKFDNFKGRRILFHDNEPLWFKILESPLFFTPFILVVFMLFFWMVDGIANLLNQNSRKDWGSMVKHIFITIFMALFFVATYDEKYSASPISAILRVVLIVLPVYLLLQYTIKNILPKKDFPDQEAIKFSIIFFGSALTIFFSVIIARWVDNTFFGASPYTVMNVINPLKLMPFFAYPIAIGNLLNNIRKNYFASRNTKKELEQTKKKALASQAELNALQASVNPHFLYNSLNSIASLATIDPAKTENMALALSNFYKYTTNRNDEHLCPLSEEIKMLNTYLEIERIRFGERLTYEINGAENTKHFNIPRFLLQPLAENAIKYGYNKNNNKIEIQIETVLNNGNLEIRVFDNGSPFKSDMQSGYGLRSITKKLKLLFPNRHSIEFINEPEKHVFISIKK